MTAPQRLACGGCEPILTVLIGPAGAGKSTWAREHFTSTQIVRLDWLRAMVADNEGDQDATTDAVRVQRLLIAARLARRLTTVVDATNVTHSARAALLQLAAAAGVDARAVVLVTPLHVCLTRNAGRPGPARGQRWGRRVPDDVVAVQHAATAAAIPVLAGEGFAGVRVLKEADRG